MTLPDVIIILGGGFYCGKALHELVQAVKDKKHGSHTPHY